jgi:hypothetical protein
VAPRRYAAISSSMPCGAEPVLDLPHGGVVGRAQPRTSSIAQLSERPGQAKGSSRSAGYAMIEQMTRT